MEFIPIFFIYGNGYVVVEFNCMVLTETKIEGFAYISPFYTKKEVLFMPVVNLADLNNDDKSLFF